MPNKRLLKIAAAAMLLDEIEEKNVEYGPEISGSVEIQTHTTKT